MPEIFTQNTDEAISRMAQIEALRSVTDAVSALRKDMREDKKILQEVRDSINRMEAADHPSRIRENRLAIEALSARVSALEAHQNKREGANGLAQVVLKSPALGWLVGAAITAWAILTGKVSI